MADPGHGVYIEEVSSRLRIVPDQVSSQGQSIRQVSSVLDALDSTIWQFGGGTQDRHDQVEHQRKAARSYFHWSVANLSVAVRICGNRFRVMAHDCGQRRASNSLAELRDTLLPKLMSGELRVPEAEDLF